jgi:WD40 repeat protein
MSLGPAVEHIGHTAFPVAMAISADGLRIVSGLLDGNLRLWDVVTGEDIAVSTETMQKIQLLHPGEQGYVRD